MYVKCGSITFSAEVSDVVSAGAEILICDCETRARFRHRAGGGQET
jgi:putative N-acetylmannosamine-6-phosphate epimerase